MLYLVEKKELFPSRQELSSLLWRYGYFRDLTFVSAAENSLSTEVYVSDDDESFSSPTPQTVYTSQTQAGDTKME